MTAVGNRRRSTVALEVIFAREKVFVLDCQRRGDERAGVDDTGLCNGDAVRVHQHDGAGRVDRSGDRGRRGAGDAIQRRRRCARLVEIDGAPGADRERVPIDDGLVRALIDIERAVLGRANRDISRRDRASRRQLLRR